MSHIMSLQNAKRAQRAVPVLSWLTPLGAVVSLVNVAISMCTSEWLTSYERIALETPNVTQHRDDFVVKRTVSGLWTLCHTNSTHEDSWHCFSIDYFAKDRYTPDPHDSTMAIPYAVTKAGPLFIVASILLLGGIFSAALGLVSRSFRIATFVAGIIFIVAGLIMLIGLVVYLSVLQSEIGQKLRPRNPLDAPPFAYYYGFGFILVVVGFMSTELTGMSAIFWYMYWHQLDWAQKSGTLPTSTSSNNLSSGNNGNVSRLSNHNRYGHRHRNHSDSMNSAPPPSYYTYSQVECRRHAPPPRCVVHPSGPPVQDAQCCCNSVRSVRKYPSNRHFNYDDEELDMDVPFPPPPPMPRDLTCTTTVSGDEFFGARDKEHRRTTPV